MDKQIHKKFLSYSEGAEVYSMDKSEFIKLAKVAKATYRINSTVLVNMEVFEAYVSKKINNDFECLTDKLDAATQVKVLWALNEVFKLLERGKCDFG